MTEPAGASLEPTGERLLPELQHGELVHAEHLVRYRLAAQLAAGRRVLDAACGEGYGTVMLASQGASRVVGVDLDERTVAHARERYGHEFLVADVASLPFEDGSFDLAVSFETIEHVPDAEATLGELSRVLAPGGLLLVSTPNKHEYLVDNVFHTREFTHGEFVDLLRARFPAVRVLYQQNWLTSAILEEGPLRDGSGEARLELDLYKVVSADPGGELYTIALCGEDPGDALRQVAVAAGVYEAHELARQLLDAKRTAELWHERFQDELRSSREMQSSLSWRITKPLRIPARVRGRRGS